MKIRTLSNQGAALVTVIMVMLVTITFAGIVLSFITSQTKTEVFYEDNLSALHSAEAGLHKYLWALNKESAVSTIAFDTEIRYPEDNPVAAFMIHSTEDSTDKKVIEASGWMLNDPTIKRTVKATYTKRAFHQFVYFSNNDPANIWWGSSDNCYGPYHTNTSLRVWGTPTFWSNVSYVVGIIPYPGATNNPDFKITPQPKEAIAFPSDNDALRAFAIADDYYYTGRTRIRLNAEGTVTILNLNRIPNLETRNLPSNGVIYVDGTTVTAANKFTTLGEGAGNVFISGVLEGRLTVAASNDIYITAYDPISDTMGTVTDGIRYNDTGFNLDISNGVVTPTGAGDDMLGLIANRHVAVLTRGWFGNSNAASARQFFTIHGAIFAITGSFINSYQIDNTGETYPRAPIPGTGILTVRGAIIQQTRGGVGKPNPYSGALASGYEKNYAHDPRMMTNGPPNFLMPNNSGWEITQWTEIN